MLQFPLPRKLVLTLCSGIAAMAVGAAPVYAQHVGGSARGGAAVGHAGGYGGYRGGYGGYRGGYGGYRGYGGYGWRGGYGGWGWRGGYWGPGWGWGWGGLGLGLYFATLPLYYDTYWWGGVPYYYADNTYYRWDGTANQYVTVAPPDGLVQQQGGAAGGQAPPQELMVYPKNGQTQEQTNKDKYECHKWATSQTGFDPTQAGGTAPTHRSDYMRAQMACLEGRGYSVK